jgi:BirA family biotin operon repressor/biotin-[acetyl-CoA-carboxylase] ligase
MSLPVDLQLSRLQPLLRTKFIGREMLVVLEAADSTNAYLLESASRGAPHGAVVAADYQTAGRGRQTRSWFSPPGAALLCSILLRPPVAPEQIAGLVLAAGLAVFQVVRSAVGDIVRLKWPNDVLINGRKAAGILCQAVLGDQPAAVVGVGLNVNLSPGEFPIELRDTSTSLSQAAGRTFDRGSLLAELLFQLEMQYENWLNDRAAVYRAWEQGAAIHGSPVRIVEAGETYDAVAERLDDEGRLIVLVEGRTRVVACGDVHLQGV